MVSSTRCWLTRPRFNSNSHLQVVQTAIQSRTIGCCSQSQRWERRLKTNEKGAASMCSANIRRSRLGSCTQDWQPSLVKYSKKKTHTQAHTHTTIRHPMQWRDVKCIVCYSEIGYMIVGLCTNFSLLISSPRTIDEEQTNLIRKRSFRVNCVHLK